MASLAESMNCQCNLYLADLNRRPNGKDSSCIQLRLTPPLGKQSFFLHPTPSDICLFRFGYNHEVILSSTVAPLRLCRAEMAMQCERRTSGDGASTSNGSRCRSISTSFHHHSED